MRLEHHLVGGYVRYISPHIIIIITFYQSWSDYQLPTPLGSYCPTALGTDVYYNIGKIILLNSW